MKKSILYFSLMCCIAFVDAQTYIPIPTDTNVLWTDHEIVDGNNTTNNAYCGEKQYFFGKNDKIINGMTYYKLFAIEKEYTSPAPIQCYPYKYIIRNYFIGYLRNDSINKKVWLRLGNSNKDTLLYDFDLKINQDYPRTFLTNYLYSHINDTIYTVVKIDSIKLIGKWHKRYGLSRYLRLDTSYIIEGVGSEKGFLSNEEHPLTGFSSKLECMSIGNKTIFPYSANGSCDLITNLAENQTNEEKILLSPNPTNGIVYLKGNIALQKIDIYNLQGQKVQSINPQKREFELPEQKGLYLIRLQDSNGRHYSRKMIKK